MVIVNKNKLPLFIGLPIALLLFAAFLPMFIAIVLISGVILVAFTILRLSGKKDGYSRTIRRKRTTIKYKIGKSNREDVS